MNATLQERLQKQLDRWQLFARCPGSTVTLLDSMLGSWNGASGYANVDTMEPMPIGAQCYIYSITKTFTAIRILQLVETGAVILTDPITRYLPELSLPPTITVRRLLNHTSGVPSYTNLPAYLPANLAAPSKPWSFDEVLQLTCQGELDFVPGEGWSYSNTGYMLLHRLIEIATKENYAAAIAHGIIQPLGLQQTYAATKVDTGQLVPGYCTYLNKQYVMEDVTPHYHPGWCLTGLIVSTTAEIAQLYQALFNGQLVNASSLKEMTTWVPSGDPPRPDQIPPPFFVKPSYGLGLMIDPGWGFGGLYGHGGDGPGFNTWAMYLPDFHGRPLTLVVFCNATMGGHPFRLTKNLLRTLVTEA